MSVEPTEADSVKLTVDLLAANRGLVNMASIKTETSNFFTINSLRTG